jgi:hypothetical protein
MQEWSILVGPVSETTISAGQDYYVLAQGRGEVEVCVSIKYYIPCCWETCVRVTEGWLGVWLGCWWLGACIHPAL